MDGRDEWFGEPTCIFKKKNIELLEEFFVLEFRGPGCEINFFS